MTCHHESPRSCVPLQNGMEVHGDALVGPLCCRSGQMDGQLLVARRGFVCGEELLFTAKVENCSRQKAIASVALTQVSPHYYSSIDQLLQQTSVNYMLISVSNLGLFVHPVS